MKRHVAANVGAVASPVRAPLAISRSCLCWSGRAAVPSKQTSGVSVLSNDQITPHLARCPRPASRDRISRGCKRSPPKRADACSRRRALLAVALRSRCPSGDAEITVVDTAGAQHCQQLQAAGPLSSEHHNKQHHCRLQAGYSTLRAPGPRNVLGSAPTAAVLECLGPVCRPAGAAVPCRLLAAAWPRRDLQHSLLLMRSCTCPSR